MVRSPRKTSHPTDFTSVGTTKDTIDVRIGYRIVELFSDGLYESPNKAIEELVSNSFDAGATKVEVLLSPDRTVSDAVIVVVDNGTSMDITGLHQHWVIGDSTKRKKGFQPPKGRRQIGKFGIGKLATFVLASHLTHICRVKGHYYAVTMDYDKVTRENGTTDAAAPIPGAKKPKPGRKAKKPRGPSKAKAALGLAAQQSLQLPLRELTEEEAKSCLPELLLGRAAIKLFGPNSEPTWTIAILSKLKSMATDIKKHHLSWVLRTAMPLRDDFEIYLDDEKLTAAKLDSPLVKRWIIGKDIKELPSVGDLEVTEDSSAGATHRYGLTDPSLGRITGYVEAYQSPLTTGKSENTGRSNGFFIYVHERLVNIDDERFGIDPDTLRHGTFTRFRAVLHIDKLDEELRSTRESVRQGARAKHAQEFAKALFNIARRTLTDFDEGETPTAKTKNKLRGAPGSLIRRPVIGLVRLILDGKVTPKYFRLPADAVSRQDSLLESLGKRLEEPDGLITDVRHESVGAEVGIAILDVATGVLLINDLHPFVAYYRDDYDHIETLRLLCVAEVLTEAYLYDAGAVATLVESVLSARDELLRRFARTQPRSASMTAQMLADAAGDKKQLEKEVVAAFDSLGFDAVPIGGSGKPDGVATARLGGDRSGLQRRYKLSLEAKSKERDGSNKVSARTVHVSGVARHRSDYECDHAVVVAPDFELATPIEASTVVKEARADASNTGKTITLMRIGDLVRLVRLQPLKALGLDKIRELFKTCITPDEARAWVDEIDALVPEKAQFKKLLEAVWSLQNEQPDEPVELAAVRPVLRTEHGLDIPKAELQDLFSALARIAPQYVILREGTVEVTQKPSTIMKEAGTALQKFPNKETSRSVFKL